MSSGARPRAIEPARRNGLRDAKRFSALGVLLTVAGTIVGTAIPEFVGDDGPLAALTGAVVVGLLSAFGIIVTDGTARGGAVKVVATLLLTALALVITISGITVADLVRGESVVGNRQTTFPVRQMTKPIVEPIHEYVDPDPHPGDGGDDLDDDDGQGGDGQGGAGDQGDTSKKDGDGPTG